jgi:hypothetical protein
MENMEPLTEAAVRSAITSVAGNLTWAAQLLDTTREDLLDYVARRPPLRELMEDIRQGLVDDAQALLRKATTEQQPWAIRVVLRTQGRRRGFGNRVEPLEPWKPPPEPEPIWDRLPEEEQVRLVELYAAIVERNKELEPAPPAPAAAQSPPTTDHSPLTTHHSPPTEEVVRTALVKFKGHLTNAAAELGMTRSALESQIERRQILRALMVNFREELIDHAESGLRLALGKGAQWAIQLVLETIGGKHGYGKAYLPAEDLDWLEPPSKYDLSVLTDAEIDEIVHLHNIAQGIEKPTVVSATAP